jgi:hypothetical protein
MFNLTPEKKKKRIKQVLSYCTSKLKRFPLPSCSHPKSPSCSQDPSLVQFAPQGEGGLVLGLLEVNLMVFGLGKMGDMLPGLVNIQKTYGK